MQFACLWTVLIYLCTSLWYFVHLLDLKYTIVNSNNDAFNLTQQQSFYMAEYLIMMTYE